MGQQPSKGDGNGGNEVAKRVPITGLMYAQLGMDSNDKKCTFRMSQKIGLGKNTSIKLFGSFQDGVDPHCRVQVTHKDYVRKAGVRVNCRLRYDLQKQFVKSSVYAKKKVKLNDTTTLNMKMEAVGRVTEMGEKSNTPGHPEYSGKLELSKTWLNASTTQDCRIRVGADLGSQRMYMQIRENHVMLNCDTSGDWKILYDF